MERTAAGHTDDKVLDALSAELVDARTRRKVVPLVSACHPGLEQEDGYRISRRNHAALVTLGERAVGRKIGFTNRGIWNEYQVYEPIWAHMYASTVSELVDQEARVPRDRFCQPRIEPEIIVRFARAPESPEPDAIAAALDWVAHGFEIVDSHHLDWKFRVTDTIADFGLHAALFVGRPLPAARIPDLVSTLSSFSIELFRDGEVVDRGRGSNVLDGPLHAIAHLMRVLATQTEFPPLSAGEMITTGTLTAAWPIAAGQRWHTRLQGVDLPGAALRFS